MNKKIKKGDKRRWWREKRERKEKYKKGRKWESTRTWKNGKIKKVKFFGFKIVEIIYNKKRMKLVNPKKEGIDNLPNVKRLNKIKKGDVVKVSNGFDRFWVVITSKRGKNLYGKIDNDIQEAKRGTKIKLKKNNIYQIYEENNENEERNGRCFIL